MTFFGYQMAYSFAAFSFHCVILTVVFLLIAFLLVFPGWGWYNLNLWPTIFKTTLLFATGTAFYYAQLAFVYFVFRNPGT